VLTLSLETAIGKCYHRTSCVFKLWWLCSGRLKEYTPHYAIPVPLVA